MKNTPLKIINYLLFLFGSFMVGTGLLLAFRLPPGSRGGRGLSLLGMSRHEWGDWHLWVSYAVIVLTILHLVYNRAWLEKIASARKTWRLVVGLGLGIALVAAFWLVPVEKSGNGESHDHDQEEHSE